MTKGEDTLKNIQQNNSNCNLCLKEAPFVCGKCYKISYCSVTCQDSDWEKHQEKCEFDQNLLKEAEGTSSEPEPQPSGCIYRTIDLTIGFNDRKKIQKPMKYDKGPKESVNLRLVRARISDDSPTPATIRKNDVVVKKEEPMDTTPIKANPIEIPKFVLTNETPTTPIPMETAGTLVKIEVEDQSPDVPAPSPTTESSIKEPPLKAIWGKLKRTDQMLGEEAKPKEPKWKSHVAVPENSTPFEVFVTEVERSTEQWLWVVPLSLQEELIEYLATMTQFYRDNSGSLGRIAKNNCKVGDLIIYPADEEYLYRCEVLEIEPEIKIRLIDFGTEVIFEDNLEVFPPLVPEKNKPAYAFKIVPKNQQIIEEIERETEIWIKIVSDDPKIAKIKLKVKRGTGEKKDGESKPPADPSADMSMNFITNNSRIMAHSLLRKDMNIGTDIDITFLDATNLDRNESTVCEYNDVNNDFYESLDDEITTYCVNNKQLLGYVPVVNEMVLVLTNEGFYARGMCVSINSNRATIVCVDYGTVLVNIPTSQIMKMAINLMYTCCAVSVQIRGLENLFANKTYQEIEKMKNDLYMNIVTADKIEKVKSHTGRYQYFVDIPLKSVQDLLN